MISAIIIENEKHSLDSLKDDLKNHCPQVKVVGESPKVSDGLALITSLQPDLVFLDIELDDGSGFNLLERLQASDKKPQIIFTTSHNEFAVKAFRFSAIDYLMKPVDADELVQAVKKAEETMNSKSVNDKLNVLFDNLKQKERPQKIALASADSILVYKIDDIIRCESQRNYTLFHFIKEKPLLVSKTMKEYEELLTSCGFERVHNSHLINMSHVKKYVKSDGGYIEMQDGSHVPVAQTRKDQIVRFLSGK